MKSLKKWLKRFALGFLVLIVLAATICAYLHSRWTALAEQKYPPSGEFIDVGGYKLHCIIQGEGPIVVMDSGIGDGGTAAWFGIEEKIARFARVCTFDRPGVGWSETSTNPGSFSQDLDDLRELLRRSNLPPPYILVGHSRGGHNMRLFASLYPTEVAGLVLIDAFNTDTFDDDAPVDQPPAPFKVMHAMRHFGLARVFYNSIVKNASDSVEPYRIEKYVELQSRSKSFDALYQCWQGQSDWADARSKMQHLGDLPVTVISAKRTEKELGWTWWSESQASLAKSVGNNVHVITADCGHHVQIERPDVVVNAIEKLLERVVSSSLQKEPPIEPGTPDPSQRAE